PERPALHRPGPGSPCRLRVDRAERRERRRDLRALGRSAAGDRARGGVGVEPDTGRDRGPPRARLLAARQPPARQPPPPSVAAGRDRLELSATGAQLSAVPRAVGYLSRWLGDRGGPPGL